MSQPTDVSLPADIAVDTLRNEVARLNDERLTLMMQLHYAQRTINAMQAVIDGEAVDVSDHVHDEVVAEDTP
jgi:hypothetical protein